MSFLPAPLRPLIVSVCMANCGWTTGAAAVPMRATEANRPVVCVGDAWSAIHCDASAAPNARPDSGVTTPCAVVPERWVIAMPGTADGEVLDRYVTCTVVDCACASFVTSNSARSIVVPR